MNWKTKTKLLAIIGMLLADGLVIAGWWMVCANGGNEGEYPLSLFSFMGIMNAAFFWFVFIYPQILKKTAKVEQDASGQRR